jgi:hypothetical protein
MDALISFYAPDVEAYPDVGFPEARPLIGREEFMSWLEGIDTAWVDAKWVASEVIAVDDGRVVYHGDWGGEGLASGIETASSITGALIIQTGGYRGLEFLFDHDADPQAVGWRSRRCPGWTSLLIRGLGTRRPQLGRVGDPTSSTVADGLSGHLKGTDGMARALRVADAWGES